MRGTSFLTPAESAAGKNSLLTAKPQFINQVIKQIEHLPTLPQVVTRVLEMVDSPTIDSMKLSKVLDQSLAAKILKVANSAFYGRRKINSIHQAIVVIGFDAVKEIILTASLFHTFHDAQDVETLRPLWQHSLECALISKRLAWIYHYEALDEAYFAGLIHDIGKLIIQQHFAAYHQQIEALRLGGFDALEAEREVLGTTHADVGGKMALHWSFPENLAHAVAGHHEKQRPSQPKLDRILHYADRFVSGALDFPGLLKAFAQVGMPYPSSWDSSDLISIEEIFQGEMEKAKSIFASTLESEF